ncbi:MAG: hypothetical protein JXM71_00995, partial [Spirochaetales bacterium]|nr:hypothetical protein [Spirochaetales bacterium]
MIRSDAPVKQLWDSFVATFAILNSILTPLYVVYPDSLRFAPLLSLVFLVLCAGDIYLEFQT